MIGNIVLLLLLCIAFCPSAGFCAAGEKLSQDPLMAGIRCDWINKELFLEPRQLTINTYRIGNIKIEINGIATHYQAEAVTRTHYHLKVWPRFREGENSIKITGHDANRKKFVRKTSIYYAKDNRVKRGSTFVIPYGEGGARAGVSFSLEVGGKTIKEMFDKSGSSASLLYFSPGSFVDISYDGEYRYAGFRALKTGMATIVITREGYLTNGMNEPENATRTIELEVVK